MASSLLFFVASFSLLPWFCVATVWDACGSSHTGALHGAGIGAIGAGGGGGKTIGGG